MEQIQQMLRKYGCWQFGKFDKACAVIDNRAGVKPRPQGAEWEPGTRGSNCKHMPARRQGRDRLQRGGVRRLFYHEFHLSYSPVIFRTLDLFVKKK